MVLSHTTNITPDKSERGESGFGFVMAIVVIAFALIVITVKHNDSDDDNKIKDQPVTAEYSKFIYRGYVLNCIDFAKMPEYGGASLSCNFEAFYRDLNKPSANDEPKNARVIKILVKSSTGDKKPMYCLHRQQTAVYHVKAADCDNVRFMHDPLAK